MPFIHIFPFVEKPLHNLRFTIIILELVSYSVFFLRLTKHRLIAPFFSSRWMMKSLFSEKFGSSVVGSINQLFRSCIISFRCRNLFRLNFIDVLSCLVWFFSHILRITKKNVFYVVIRGLCIVICKIRTWYALNGNNILLSDITSKERKT